mmetsp:Transcript_20996/g.20130  ORF Transcript_20996/g.20130 Transcript_20996/m.20130 type:complete len:131 (-) Transcript_20996:126-518(-)
MVDEELSTACNNDMKHYIKCFFDFYYKKYQREDEIMDLIQRLKKRFNESFEKNEVFVIEQIITCLKTSHEGCEYKAHLLTIFKLVLIQYFPKKSMAQEEQKNMTERLNTIQNIMIKIGTFDLIINSISSE